MLKLILCLICGLIIGATVLQLRARQLELRSQVVTLQQRIEKRQAKLWSQQMQISVYTSPRAVVKAADELPLVPEGKLPPEAGHWVRAGE